jgi:hypothetical protein
MEINLDKYAEPKVYQRAGKDCYYDRVSKRLRPKTPEENVRMRMIELLHKEMKVPYEAMEIEVPMTDFKKGARGRMDIGVYAIQEDKLVTMLVVECKAADVMITGDAVNQVLGYGNITGAPFNCVTNGSFLLLCWYNADTNEYEEVAELPDYKQLCGEKELKTVPLVSEPYKRYSTIEEASHEMFDSIGEDTDKTYYPLIVQLEEALMDDNKFINQFQAGKYSITDIGVRLTRFGNAGGGGFPGSYRSFRVNYGHGEQIVGIGIFATGHYENHPQWHNQKGLSYIFVTVDDFEKHHASLELCIDTCSMLNKDTATFFHDGRMAVGNLGAAKRAEVIDYVRNHEKDLKVVADKVMLGKIKYDKELYLSDPEVKQLVTNLIKYALVRDELRGIIKERKSKAKH